MKPLPTTLLLLATVLAAHGALAQDDHGGQNPGQGDQGDAPTVTQRAEPLPQAPADPLAIDPALRKQIGSDYGLDRPPPPQGKLKRRFYGIYEESRGDYRFRMLPPFFFEHTRGLPSHPDRQSLFGLMYYQRRSLKLDADVLFPLFWHVRDEQSYLTVVGPMLHRQAPGENDNWLAPLFFQGKRKDGGYFHAPLLLTSSHWNNEGAFTLAGPYFRNRTGTDVDAGIVPIYFHGDNGNDNGARKTYTLIPPLLFYHRSDELNASSLTVAGPVIFGSTPERTFFHLAPFFFHIHGTPETGGIHESHTTVFPFFHYGYTDTESLFVTPVYLRRKAPGVDTLITPVYAHATTRKGAAELTTVGPIVPLFFHYTDRDVRQSSWGLIPFYYRNTSETRNDFLTPLFGRFENIGVSRTYWAFPSLVVSFDQHGWETDLHPVAYFGRHDKTRHNVLLPFYFDLATPDDRVTVGFPLYWRFADHKHDAVVQVAGNTLYTQRRVAGGMDWAFHVLPFFSYGESPDGYYWNVLFGLAGYERTATASYVKALWLPIRVSGGDPQPRAAWR